MSTTYQFLCDGAPGRPVRFRDLVRMVHSGELGADDLVRADYEDHWRPAATVVGLFHMAGRAEVLELWDREETACSELAPVSSNAAAPTGGLYELPLGGALVPRSGPSAEPSAADAGDRIDAAALPPEGEEVVERGGVEADVSSTAGRQQTAPAEVASWDAGARSTWESPVPAAIDAAVSAHDLKEEERSAAWCRSPVARPVLHQVLRWGVSLVLANLMAVGIVSWSSREARRMPNVEDMAAGIRPFPLWGTCPPAQFAALLVGTMGMSGAAGYAGARALESLADD